MKDPNLLLAVIALLNFATAILAWRTHRSQVNNTAVIIELERNTNSIKDALVKSVGEAAFSAGENKARLDGEEKAKKLLIDGKK